jgi:hypothetical protein
MSKYNSFQFKVQQRFSESFTSIMSTWSRSIDTSSGWFNAEGGIGGGASVQNYHDIDSNRALSSYDILEVRLEVFNVFNHINEGNPVVDITNVNAGRITTMSGRPRQAQVGFRLVY